MTRGDRIRLAIAIYGTAFLFGLNFAWTWVR
jgi:hypothetical protein